MTLVELVVALTLLAIAASLVVPALLTPDQPQVGLQAVVSRARDLAVARSQTLEVKVARNGTYQVSMLSGGTPLIGGAIDTPASSAHFIITPLGACLVKAADPNAAHFADAARCILANGGAAS